MSKISAVAYGQMVREKVIFRREYNHYTKAWGYLVGFPEENANPGRIVVLDFRIFEDGTIDFGCHDEVDKNYFTRLKLVHKGTEEAEMCLKVLRKMYPNESFYVGEKITKKDRCY